MRKKLCLTCAQALQKRADIRYTGKRTRMDMCSGCHSKMLVTEYIVPDEPVPITPKPEPKSAAVQYKLGEKLTMTVAVDNRTAGAILRYAERWAIEPGEVIDSLMRFYKRAMKERYNHEQLWVDRTCGGYLSAAYASGKLDLESLDLTNAVQSVSEGDTSVTFAADASDSARLSALISSLLTAGEEDLLCFRKLRW